MGNKKRGTAAEREFLHKLWDEGFACCRVAGSGSIPEPSCDLLAGNGIEKMAIEVKLSKDTTKYFKKNQMEEFQQFAGMFGLSAILAVKFIRKDWWFINPKQLRKTPKGLCITLEEIQKKGLSFEEFLNC